MFSISCFICWKLVVSCHVVHSAELETSQGSLIVTLAFHILCNWSFIGTLVRFLQAISHFKVNNIPWTPSHPVWLINMPQYLIIIQRPFGPRKYRYINNFVTITVTDCIVINLPTRLDPFSSTLVYWCRYWRSRWHRKTSKLREIRGRNKKYKSKHKRLGKPSKWT